MVLKVFKFKVQRLDIMTYDDNWGIIFYALPGKVKGTIKKKKIINPNEISNKTNKDTIFWGPLRWNFEGAESVECSLCEAHIALQTNIGLFLIMMN